MNLTLRDVIDSMTDSTRGAILRWQGRLAAARILRAERQPDGRFARHLRILRDQLGLAETVYRPIAQRPGAEYGRGDDEVTA